MKGAGFGLLALLLAALIAAALFMTQMNSAGSVESKKEEAAATVSETKETVNAVNDAINERAKQYENIT